MGNSGNVDLLSNVGASITYLIKPVKQQSAKMRRANDETLKRETCYGAKR